MYTQLANIDFSNTEVAFKNKTNSELRQAHMLFKVMNNNFMVNMGKHMVNFAFSIHFPVDGIIRKTIYRHFVGGTSISDCAKTINKLAERNVGAILDFAVEGEEEDALFDETCKEVLRTIELAKDNKNIPFSAFKITGIGRFLVLAKKSDQVELCKQEEDELDRIYK